MPFGFQPVVPPWNYDPNAPQEDNHIEECFQVSFHLFGKLGEVAVVSKTNSNGTYIENIFHGQQAVDLYSFICGEQLAD